jgi:hypothetical protein
MEKTLTFQEPRQLQSRRLAVEFIFPFSMVDSSLVGKPEEKSLTSQHQIKVTASLQLTASWGFPTTAGQHTQYNIDDLPKVLYEYGKRYVVEKLETVHNLATEEELNLDETKVESGCAFEPSVIENPSGAIIKVNLNTSGVQSKQQKGIDTEIVFVDLNRIDELRAIKSTQFDLARLVRFCEELNICYKNECYLAVAMLTRALIDHIPPIFGFNSFSNVASNYAGAKSFKEQMEHLQNSSRKISDAHLHIQSRPREILPNRTQVNFANDIDVLLSEIIRLLK